MEFWPINKINKKQLAFGKKQLATNKKKLRMNEEPHIVPYLIKIVNTISTILIWMIANVFFGIYLGYGFFEGSPTLYNFIYYAAALLSLGFLIRHIIKKWKS